MVANFLRAIFHFFEKWNIVPYCSNIKKANGWIATGLQSIKMPKICVTKNLLITRVLNDGIITSLDLIPGDGQEVIKITFPRGSFFCFSNFAIGNRHLA